MLNQREEIRRLIRQTYRSWLIEDMDINDSFNHIIALTVIISTKGTPFNTPENWNCTPLANERWVCVRALPK